ELIEAFHLFPVSAEALDCVVHPQSIVHCLVSYVDGSVLAQLAAPDMRTPIAVALAWPNRMVAATERLDLARLRSLTFEAPKASGRAINALELVRGVQLRSPHAPLRDCCSMEFLATLATWIWQYGIVFLSVLTLVVFVHELGHFLIARRCGVTVRAFSIGFGP